MDLDRIASRVASTSAKVALSADKLDSIHKGVMKRLTTLRNQGTELLNLISDVDLPGGEEARAVAAIDEFVSRWSPQLEQMSRDFNNTIRRVGDAVVRSKR